MEMVGFRVADYASVRMKKQTQILTHKMNVNGWFEWDDPNRISSRPNWNNKMKMWQQTEKKDLQSK